MYPLCLLSGEMTIHKFYLGKIPVKWKLKLRSCYPPHSEKGYWNTHTLYIHVCTLCTHNMLNPCHLSMRCILSQILMKLHSSVKYLNRSNTVVIEVKVCLFVCLFVESLRLIQRQTVEMGKLFVSRNLHGAERIEIIKIGYYPTTKKPIVLVGHLLHGGTVTRPWGQGHCYDSLRSRSLS